MTSTSARRPGADFDHADTALGRAIDWLGHAFGSRAATAARHRPMRDLAAAAGMTAFDVVTAIRGRRIAASDRAQPPVSSSVVIRKPRAEVYAFYRKLAQLPLFMDLLVSVREVDDRWSHWVARLPSGTVAWDVKITDDLPGELLEWRSVKGSVIKLRGQAVFTDLPGGATEVRIELRTGAPSTRQGRKLARLFSASQLASDLRRLKLVLEDPDDLITADVAPRNAPPPFPFGDCRPSDRSPRLVR
jgi:uncharacterized membrane protein